MSCTPEACRASNCSNISWSSRSSRSQASAIVGPASGRASPPGLGGRPRVNQPALAMARGQDGAPRSKRRCSRRCAAGGQDADHAARLAGHRLGMPPCLEPAERCVQVGFELVFRRDIRRRVMGDVEDQPGVGPRTDGENLRPAIARCVSATHLRPAAKSGGRTTTITSADPPPGREHLQGHDMPHGAVKLVELEHLQHPRRCALVVAADGNSHS